MVDDFIAKTVGLQFVVALIDECAGDGDVQVHQTPYQPCIHYCKILLVLLRNLCKTRLSLLKLSRRQVLVLAFKLEQANMHSVLWE